MLEHAILLLSIVFQNWPLTLTSQPLFVLFLLWSWFLVPCPTHLLSLASLVGVHLRPFWSNAQSRYPSLSLLIPTTHSFPHLPEDIKARRWSWLLSLTAVSANKLTVVSEKGLHDPFLSHRHPSSWWQSLSHEVSGTGSSHHLTPALGPPTHFSSLSGFLIFPGPYPYHLLSFLKVIH